MLGVYRGRNRRLCRGNLGAQTSYARMGTDTRDVTNAAATPLVGGFLAYASTLRWDGRVILQKHPCVKCVPPETYELSGGSAWMTNA